MTQSLKELGDHVAAAFPQDVIGTEIAYGELMVNVRREGILRVLAFLGGYPRRVKGVPGVDWWGLNLDIKQGGHTIEYRDEDPYIRKMFQDQLAKEGAEFNMPEEVYR